MVKDTDDPISEIVLNVKMSMDDYPLHGGPPMGAEGFRSNVDDSIEADIGKAKKDQKPPIYIHLKFVDVRYRVKKLRSGARWRWRGGAAAGPLDKEILHGITGHVGSGEMLALMGPSGSGKTTFLKLLAGRKLDHGGGDGASGSILYNGLPCSKSLKRRMGFVSQDDVLFPHLTVRETLTFAALLRLPKLLSREAKMERVEDVMMQLGLQKCSETVIGNQFLAGVSGGERRRVCIGQEILVDPSVIFLDEPTSGLDSTTTLRLIKLLQNIAHEGRTVVATIHQPSSRAFHMFDKLLLLSEGHCVYMGQARAAMGYFNSLGFSPLIAMNPADFLLDLCSGITTDISLPTSTAAGAAIQSAGLTHPSPTALADVVKCYLVERFEDLILDTEESISMLKIQAPGGASELQSDYYVATTKDDDVWGTSWWEQFLILLVRGLKERRHDYLSKMRVTQVIVSAILAGCLWWKSQHNTPQQLQDQVGLIFFIAVFWAYFPLFTAVFTFPLERAVVTKERASKMYHLSAYFMARTLGDLPLDLLLPFIFMTILYFMTSLQQTTAAFFQTLMTIFLTVIASQGLGLLIGASMMDVQKAATFSSITILAFMLGGGFFVRKIPPFVAWIKYLSFQAHTYNILIQIQYGGDKSYDCASKIGCQNIGTAPALENSSLHGALQSTLALVAMVFGYRVLAYIALRRMRTVA